MGIKVDVLAQLRLFHLHIMTATDFSLVARGQIFLGRGSWINHY